MKKLHLLILAFLAYGICSGQATWVQFTDPSPQEPEVQLISSSNTLVEFDIEIFGMYSENINEQGTTYQRINIPSCGKTFATGEPELPTIRKMIAIPECSDYNITVNVLQQDVLTLNNYYVYPVPDQVPTTTPEGIEYLEEQFTIDNTLYQTDQDYTSANYEVKSVGYFRDQKYLEIIIYPIQFNPVQSQLTVNTKYNVEVTFTIPTTSVNVNTGVFNSIVSGMFLNYTSNGMSASQNDNVQGNGQINWYTLTSVQDAENIVGDYLIITHGDFFDPNNQNNALYEIADHRATYNGFDVAIVDVQNILNVFYDGPEDPLLYSTETKIRNFVNVVYESENAFHTYDNKLGYVLIVGDAKGAVGGAQNSNFGVPTSFHTPAWYEDNKWGNDFFYCCVTEDNNTFDVTGDLFIGRFCVRTETELQNIVTKSKFYETEFDNTNNWQEQYYSFNSEGIDPDEFLYHMYDYLNNFIINPYELTISDQFVIGSQSIIDDVTSEFNLGKNYVHYYGHGQYDNYSIGQYPYLNINLLKQNLQCENKNPFALNYTCYTGTFYLEDNNECLAAEMTHYSNSEGFIGCLASARLQGLINTWFGEPVCIGSGLIHNQIINGLSHITGEFILEAKNKTTRPYEKHQLNYFGDPALNLFAHGYEVTKNLNLSNEVTISTPVYVRSGYRLNLNSNCILSFTDNGQLIIEDGATLQLTEGCTIQGMSPEHQILIQGELDLFGELPNYTFTAPVGYEWTGLVFESSTKTYNLNDISFTRCGISGTSLIMNIEDCDFNDAFIDYSYGELNVENCYFVDGYIKASNGTLVKKASIVNCSFDNQNIYDYPIYIDSYKQFDIHGNNIKHNDRTGIAIYNSKGVKGAEVHDIYDNEVYSKTAGSGNTDFGIRIYNSHADIINDNYIYNNFVGLVSYNTSEVNLLGDCNAANEAQAQKIKNNSLRQVYADENSFPTDFMYNVIYDDNASTYYVYHDRSFVGFPDTYITNNYWGTSFVPANHLYPAPSFIYNPIWSFGCNKSGEVEFQYDSAINYIISEEYDLAENMFISIVQENPDSKYSKASLKQLFSLKDLHDNDFVGLKLFYDTTTVLQDTTEISKLADWLSNKCDVKLANYQTAINWYEAIIDNPETENDSTFAIIDLGYTYLLMEDSTQRQSIACKYPQYIIPNRNNYQTYRDFLLDRLIGTTSTTDIEEERLTNDIDAFDLQMYPNPTNDHFELKFSALKVVRVGILIFDNTGRIVLERKQSKYDKGENTIHFNMEQYSPGIYNCVIHIDQNKTITKKIIKL
ncbi:MAG: C25 family cysteine peptidase [Bacteroidota bacterium]|nr:C25 family cysteine peptidase [Bacteroidota bacterium]